MGWDRRWREEEWTTRGEGRSFPHPEPCVPPMPNQVEDVATPPSTCGRERPCHPLQWDHPSHSHGQNQETITTTTATQQPWNTTRHDPNRRRTSSSRRDTKDRRQDTVHACVSSQPTPCDGQEPCMGTWNERRRIRRRSKPGNEAMRPTSPSNRSRSRDECERKDGHHAWTTYVRTSDRIRSLHAAAWSHHALSSHVVSCLAAHARPSGTVRDVPERNMEHGRRKKWCRFLARFQTHTFDEASNTMRRCRRTATAFRWNARAMDDSMRRTVASIDGTMSRRFHLFPTTGVETDAWVASRAG